MVRCSDETTEGQMVRQSDARRKSSTFQYIHIYKNYYITKSTAAPLKGCAYQIKPAFRPSDHPCIRPLALYYFIIIILSVLPLCLPPRLPRIWSNSRFPALPNNYQAVLSHYSPALNSCRCVYFRVFYKPCDTVYILILITFACFVIKNPIFTVSSLLTGLGYIKVFPVLKYCRPAWATASIPAYKYKLQ